MAEHDAQKDAVDDVQMAEITRQSSWSVKVAGAAGGHVRSSRFHTVGKGGVSGCV